MNAEFCRQAVEKIGNPNILVNLVSKRVRQLTSAGGAGSRPLVENAEHQGAADIALREIVEDKITYELLPEEPEPVGPAPRRRRG